MKIGVIGAGAVGAARAEIPVGAYSARFGVTFSLPSVLGRHGVRETLAQLLSPEEERALEQSAATLRQASERIGLARPA